MGNWIPSNPHGINKNSQGSVRQGLYSWPHATPHLCRRCSMERSLHPCLPSMKQNEVVPNNSDSWYHILYHLPFFPVSIPYSFTDVSFNSQIRYLCLNLCLRVNFKIRHHSTNIYWAISGSEYCRRSCCIPEKLYKVNGLHCHFGEGNRFIMLT